jgi:hypothetical protein
MMGFFYSIRVSLNFPLYLLPPVDKYYLFVILFLSYVDYEIWRLGIIYFLESRLVGYYYIFQKLHFYIKKHYWELLFSRLGQFGPPKIIIFKG